MKGFTISLEELYRLLMVSINVCEHICFTSHLSWLGKCFSFHKLYLYKEYKARCIFHLINCPFITKEIRRHYFFFVICLIKISLKGYTYNVKFL